MVREFFEALGLPLLLIAVVSYFLFRVVRKGRPEVDKEIFGVALGVVLGFVSQLTVGAFDDFRKDQKIRTATLRLLEQDAVGIYRSMWRFDRLLKIKSPATAGVEVSVPPSLNMQYWNGLKGDTTFLFLARDPRFAKIFGDFRDFEEINRLIEDGNAKKGQSDRLAVFVYHSALKDQAHRKLLLHFMTDREIDDMDRKHVDDLRTKNIKNSLGL